MKYNAKQMLSGKWAVYTGKKYFTYTVCDTELEAQKYALYWSANYHQQQMDKIHKQLDAMGEIDRVDPYGYLA